MFKLKGKHKQKETKYMSAVKRIGRPKVMCVKENGNEGNLNY